MKINRSTIKGTKNNDPKLGRGNADKGKINTPPVKYNINLRTAEDVRRLLSLTVNQLRRGQLDVQIARTIIYAASTLLAVFEQCSLEARLAKLEEAVNRM